MVFQRAFALGDINPMAGGFSGGFQIMNPT